jgi:hypothetical protein
MEVLEILPFAYGGRDLDRYARLFADDFTFFFDPPDSAGTDFPRSWNRQKEMASAGNLFRSEAVDRIELDLDPGTLEPSPQVIADSWRVRTRIVRLRLVRRGTRGQRDTLQVSGGTELFYLRPDSTRLTWDGRPTWYIVRWEDLGPAVTVRKVEETSWSVLKYLYRD